MVQAPDGHLLVFHNLHNTLLYVARSPYPHSIDGTWTEQRIAEGDGATYPMPFVTDNGTVFVFIRETRRDLDHVSQVDDRPMKYVRSTDSGLTWTNTMQLTGDPYAMAPATRPDNMNEIYIGQLRHEPARFGIPERVLIVYTLAGGGAEGHLHDRYHKNIYYTYFTPGDLHFHAADGRDLGTRIDDAEQEAYLKVADTPFLAAPFQRSPDYISLVGEVLPGLPFVVWMQFDPTGALHDNLAVVTPHGWHVTEVGTGERVRDMEPLGILGWRVYATKEPPPGGVAPSGIQTFRTLPGLFWVAGPEIPTAQAVQRIEVIGDHRDPARILATGASSARDVTTADGDVYVIGVSR
jgi:BNR repeat-containing family member